MATIYHIGPIPPIMCGIATYTDYLIRKSPAGKWGMISFNPETYGSNLTKNSSVNPDRIWFGLKSRSEFSANDINNGLRHFDAKKSNSVLWFQHETAIWQDPQKFTEMLKQIDFPIAVSFHTLHFQSKETEYGLRQKQYDLLKSILPHVNIITVFTYGVYRAVISAFPEFYDKVYVTKHGMHLYPEIKRMSRKEARTRLEEYLMNDTSLDHETKQSLQEQQVFSDANAILLGQTGFLCPHKSSETLYNLADSLKTLLPSKRIISMRIGSPREDSHAVYARNLRTRMKSSDKFLLETWLPPELLPIAQRAFNVNFYWPEECTQSGILAHALGAGAIVVGKDIEGFGETLKESGGIAEKDIHALTHKIGSLLLTPELQTEIEEQAWEYAETFSWKNQVRRHYELANEILNPLTDWTTYPSLPASPLRSTAGDIGFKTIHDRFG